MLLLAGARQDEDHGHQQEDKYDQQILHIPYLYILSVFDGAKVRISEKKTKFYLNFGQKIGVIAHIPLI